MLYVLVIAAAVLFIAHVVLLIASFRRSGFSGRRYFYSHLTLWLTGICVFVLALQYHGQQVSGFLDYFSTVGRLAMILVFTVALSLVAHLIVKLLVLPALEKK
jgi:hypothetical protein